MKMYLSDSWGQTKEDKDLLITRVAVGMCVRKRKQ